MRIDPDEVFGVVPNRAEKRRRLRQWGEPKPDRPRRTRKSKDRK